MFHTHAHSLDDLLADPLIQMVMKADKVEPAALRGLLTGAASRVRADRTSRALTFDPVTVRFGAEARREPLRVPAVTGYTGGGICLHC